MVREEVMELYMIDIERIQSNKRGLSINQQLLYEKLENENIEFGESTFINGKLLNTGRYSDKGVRKDLFKDYRFFWFNNDKGEREYLPSDQEMWDLVEVELKKRERNESINDLLNDGFS